MNHDKQLKRLERTSFAALVCILLTLLIAVILLLVAQPAKAACGCFCAQGRLLGMCQSPAEVIPYCAGQCGQQSGNTPIRPAAPLPQGPRFYHP